jgi:hypothetical protein
VDLSQLVESAAKAMYDAWIVEENQRRREERVRRATDVGSLYRNPAVPRDLPEWWGLPHSEREAFRMRARPVVLALEREGRLNVGDTRRYYVEVDDPDLAERYSYVVEAMSAQAAAWEAARRAARADPLTFLYGGAHHPPMPFPRLPAAVHGRLRADGESRADRSDRAVRAGEAR